MDGGVPIGDGPLSVDGDDRMAKDIFGCYDKALDLAGRGDCLHLPADIEQVVFDIFEHIDLRNDELADAVGLHRESLQLHRLQAAQGFADGAEWGKRCLLYRSAKELKICRDCR